MQISSATPPGVNLKLLELLVATAAPLKNLTCWATLSPSTSIVMFPVPAFSITQAVPAVILVGLGRGTVTPPPVYTIFLPANALNPLAESIPVLVT